MDDNELTDAWADLKAGSTPRGGPEMPLGLVRLAGLDFSTVCLHNADHRVNLRPKGRAWYIEGLANHPTDSGVGHLMCRVLWTRGRRWQMCDMDMDMRLAPLEDCEWLAYELEAEIPLAVANKLSTMT